MGKLNFNEVEQHLMLKSLIYQRDELQKQLLDINSLIAKCKGENIDDNKVVGLPTPQRQRLSADNQLMDKMFSVLNTIPEYLTSRQILEQIKKEHEDVRNLDKTSERKYMAILSARLTKAYSDGIIDKIKNEGKDAIYGIKKGQLSVAHV